MEKQEERLRKTSKWLTFEQSKRLNGKDRERYETWRKERIRNEGKDREKRRKRLLPNEVKYKIIWNRKTPKRFDEIMNGNEFEIQRIRQWNEYKGKLVNRKERKRRLEEERKVRILSIMNSREEKRLNKVELNNSEKALQNKREWKEQVVRVGTGYRVRKDEKEPQRRRFDVGYSDRKEYKRKEGREVVVDQSSMGRTVIGKGENARVKVINAVCEMEKRRPSSVYTGSGIIRKSEVGKRKLKPTKPQTKQ